MPNPFGLGTQADRPNYFGLLNIQLKYKEEFVCAEIRLTVKGESPKPWGSNEWEWRRAVAEAAREQRGILRSEGYFDVEITFYLNSQSFSQSDLDNLAKPVLDTLFHAEYPQTKSKDLTGALLPGVDDDRVISLFLKKIQVDETEELGAEITVWSAG
jgi:Holliday junction resolvase RusA-like endonuclease